MPSANLSGAASPPRLSAMMLSWSVGEQRPLDLNGPRNDFRPFEPAWLEQPLVALFADAAARYPEHVACEDVADRLTFAATLATSRRLAVSIDAKVPRGAAVGVLLPNEACYPAAVLACLGAGHTCVLVDRNYPQDRVAAIVRDAGLAAVILR